LSARESEAERVPVEEGVKVTLIEQLAPAVRLVPQLLVDEKSAAFAPAILSPDMVSALPPLLVKVTDCGALAVFTVWLAKLRLLADKVAVGGVAAPVPKSEMLWGLPAALSAIVSEADLLPEAVGLKVTLIAQLAPEATLVPQLLDCAKSTAFAPAMLN
jgi:hypothetical protein